MRNKHIPFWLKVEELVLLEFYRYTSIVQEQLIRLEFENVKEFPETKYWFDQFKQKMLSHKYDITERQDGSNIQPIQFDNKIAIKCKTPSGGILYIGFKDNNCVIGLSVQSDNWVKPYKIY